MSWPTVTLGDLCSPKQWPTLSKAQMSQTGYIVYGANGPIGFSQNITHRIQTILIGCRGSCGSVHVIPAMSYANGNAMALDKLNERKVSLDYLALFLQARGFKDVVTGSSQPQIIRSNIVRIEVPLPPLDEQQRITAILDKADVLRRKRKHALALLDEIAQSIFLECFGDIKSNSLGFPTSTLGEVASFYSGNSLPEGENFIDQPDGFLLLKVSDLSRSGNDTVLNSAARWQAHPGTRSGTCITEAVVFPKRGGAIATNRKRKLLRSAILDPNLMAVSPNPKFIDLNYLFGWFQNFKLEEISSGSSVPQLNKQDLSPLSIIIPPVERQNKYRMISNNIEQHRKILTKGLIDESTLFESLQQRAFSGKL